MRHDIQFCRGPVDEVDEVKGCALRQQMSNNERRCVVNETEPTRPEDEQEDRQRERREAEARPRPRIYVASLSDYNDGRLHGRWMDAAIDDEELHAEVAAMLAASPMPGAEEFAIHDYEGFGPVRVAEYEPLGAVARIARGIAEHGPAFAHWASLVGSDPDALERFEDAYLGQVESIESYAEDLLDDLGILRQLDDALPEQLHPYVTFDVAGFARDLELSGDVVTSEAPEGVYVFSGVI